MKENILKLRSEGKSYQEICQTLGCTKSTVAYHCNRTTKDKVIQKNNEYRKKIPLIVKVDRFKRDSNNKGNCNYTTKDVIDKLGNNPRCYLTGKEIDLSDSRIIFLRPYYSNLRWWR